MAVTLIEPIGEGGFADVWKGIDELDREVAVKIIRPASIGVSDALSHAKALARAEHKNVVAVYKIDQVSSPDPNEDELVDCVVMELIRGRVLGKLLSQADPISEKDASRICHGMIDGLAHIFEQGLVHGDLHDQNVMVTDDEIKIIDILYRDSLALHSSASREFRMRSDINALTLMIGSILDRLGRSDNVRVQFLQKLSSKATVVDLREALSEVIGPVDDPEQLVCDESTIESPFVDPAIFFHTDRFTEAFPGVRGIQYFEKPCEIIERLEILLRNPLGFRKPNDAFHGVQHPIWWFRGYSNMHIERFERLSENEILINGIDEWRIKKAAAYNSSSYYEDFVYLEFEPMEPTGLYERTPEYIAEWAEKLGGVHDEYGLYNGQMITRAEYDDGAAVINGKVVRTAGSAKLRSRYITPYNLVIASQKSPINTIGFDRKLEAFMRAILKGTSTLKDLTEALRYLPKKESLY